MSGFELGPGFDDEGLVSPGAWAEALEALEGLEALDGLEGLEALEGFDDWGFGFLDDWTEDGTLGF